MIVATQNIYYLNRMYKPKEVLPCIDIKMVNAWLASGVAIDTDKEQNKPAPKISKIEAPKNEIEKKELQTEKSETKIKTNSKKK